MFFQKNYNIAIFTVIAALMLWANLGMTQTEWEKYPGNPVLDLGESGTWDDSGVYSHTILFDGSEYKMWYSGHDGSNVRIGYATSADSIVWEKYPANPVLGLGADGTWDDIHVRSPTVLFDGAEYRMWYHGFDGSNHRIGYATSADGIVWVKHPDNPVLDLGASGTWDDVSVVHPTVLFDGTEYKMWYTGSGSNSRIGYATSADGIVWVKYPENPVLDLGASGTWDDYQVGAPTVLFDGTKYQMWYAGHDDSIRRIGYATSADGIAWEKYPDNPVLGLGASGTWDDNEVAGPTVLFDGTKYQMGYTGRGPDADVRIGYATSIPDTGSINGTVTDIAGNPLRALVSVINIKWTLTNPDDGFYEITDLEPRTYLVIAIKRGYRAGFARVAVEAGKTITQDFKLRPKSRKDAEDEFTDLYENYPNPFNPETWIPFKLATDSPVTVSIYNQKSQLIRTINLGEKRAGNYITKDKAAYWDGRNDFGERVSSGVYFYTFRAGEFKATRRMLVVK
ncbi:carboxypeptidase regulatory-like domain-containing protein [bacterium]|nr:carboxypeptidase regulatory-like domain-containing protein [bacterium]